MSGFAKRIHQHDKLTLEAVRTVLAGRGVRLHPFGGELSPVLRKELRSLANGTSKMLRYRPDQVAVIPGKKRCSSKSRAKRAAVRISPSSWMLGKRPKCGTKPGRTPCTFSWT